MLCRVLRKLLNRTKISLPVKIRRLLRLEDLSPPPSPPPISFKPALNGVNRGFTVAPLLYHCFMSTVQMGLQSLILLVVFLLYSGTSLIRSTMGQKNSPHWRGFFFFTRNVWPFCQVAKKGAVKRGDHITKVAVRRGSTVLKFWLSACFSTYYLGFRL